MTFRELDAKYRFSLKKVSEDSGMTYETVQRILRREENPTGNIKTLAKIINALPITPNERTALIETMFSPPNQ